MVRELRDLRVRFRVMDEGDGGQPPDVAVQVSTLPDVAMSEAPPRENAQAGDREATLVLSEVYRAHVDFVWRIVRRLGVPDDVVDDVVHDVFLVVQRRIDDYDPRYSMRSWLVGIARRVSKDYFRGRERRRARLRLVPQTPVGASPEEVAVRTEAADFVRGFLDTLDLEQRMVFMLTDVEGMSAPEIARALRVKLPTVYSRLRLARQKFERAVARLHAQQGRQDGRAR
jgi:RNA polymerase sigma-70 factor, ECF subfamily